MSDRTIIGGMSRLHAMLIAAENDLAAKKKNDQKFYAFQEDHLAQLRVTIDDMEVMLGIVPRPGSVDGGEGQRELPHRNPVSGPQAVFTAIEEGPNGNGGKFRGADV